MSPAQIAFLVALAAIGALIAIAAAGVIVASRRASGPGPSLVARLSQPSTARLEVHRWAFLAHRVGGLAILGFLVLHLVDVGLVAVSPALYDEVHALYGTAPLRVLEVGLFGAIVFHAANGLRLIALDLVDAGAATAERLLWLTAALTLAAVVPAALIILGPVAG